MLVLLGSKPVSIPLELNHQLAKAVGACFAFPDQYYRLIGKLIYLTITRLNLAYTVYTLTQLMQKPCVEHWTAALRAVRFLKGTPGYGILV